MIEPLKIIDGKFTTMVDDEDLIRVVKDLVDKVNTLQQELDGLQKCIQKQNKL